MAGLLRLESPSGPNGPNLQGDPAMRLNRSSFTVGALAFALSVGGLSAEAAQQRDNRDRNGGRDSHGQARARDDHRGSNDRRDDHGGDAYRGNGYRYAPPRVIVPYRTPYSYRTPYPHYYGSGGHLSVYFGLGSGYLYGSPYYGRVYGGPATMYGYAGGGRIYYGDVRLQVRPRGAAVYVDGYYAGIVDDFDGVFQRLTLVVGPHEIEIEAPGLQPQVFNVYVDPSRTVDLRGDLYPGRP